MAAFTDHSILKWCSECSTLISILESIESKRFFLASSLSGILVDGRRLCPKIINNEVSAKERLPLDYAWHSCMY